MNTMNLNSQEINKSDSDYYTDKLWGLLWEHLEPFNVDEDDETIYFNYLDKMHYLLTNTNCKTYEHFISILITIEDYFCECPFFTDEMKHKKLIELIEYRINFMNNKNTIK